MVDDGPLAQADHLASGLVTIASGGDHGVAQRGEGDPRLDRGVERAVQRRPEVAAQHGVAHDDLVAAHETDAARDGVGMLQRALGDLDLLVAGQEGEGAVGPELDPGHVGAEGLPEESGAQGHVGLAARCAARDPQQAEIAHRRAGGHLVAFELGDLGAARQRGVGVQGPQHASAHDDHVLALEGGVDVEAHGRRVRRSGSLRVTQPCRSRKYSPCAAS